MPRQLSKFIRKNMLHFKTDEDIDTLVQVTDALKLQNDDGETETSSSAPH
jgi:hypothetical protein